MDGRTQIRQASDGLAEVQCSEVKPQLLHV